MCPPSWFQKTVISSNCKATPVGLLIVMLKVVPEIVSGPCVTRLQFPMGVLEAVGVYEGVGVKEGVGVLLGVKVAVGVDVFVGVYVIGVYVGDGVNVLDGVGVCVGGSVGVKVSVGAVVDVGVVPLKVDAEVTSMDTLKRTVRELDATIGFMVKGTNLGTRGL